LTRKKPGKNKTRRPLGRRAAAVDNAIPVRRDITEEDVVGNTRRNTMTDMQVAILKAAALGGAIAEVTQFEDSDCEIDPVDCIVQAGHEALVQLQENPQAVADLCAAAKPVLAVFAVEPEDEYPLVQALLA
jgi:hypothetical protein